jgi:hypothetical protein
MNEEIVPVVKNGNAHSDVCSVGDVYCVYSSVRGEDKLPGCGNAPCVSPHRISMYRTEALKLALRGHPDLA